MTLEKKKNVATARATSSGHLNQSSHFWHLATTLSGPVILMFLQLWPRLSLRSCTWPLDCVKAFLSQTTDVLPAVPSYLSVIFFSAKYRTRWFPFRGGLLFNVEFLGSLDIMALSSICTCYQGAWDWKRLKQGHYLATVSEPPLSPLRYPDPGLCPELHYFFCLQILKADSPLLLPLKFNFSCHILPVNPKFTMLFSMSKAQLQQWFKFFLEDILTPHANHYCKYVLGWEAGWVSNFRYLK